jgi:hypothetical protein
VSTDEAPASSVLSLVSPLSRAELFVVLLHVVHARHGTYYNLHLTDPMTTNSTSSTTNPWDGKTLLFRANNPTLTGQVYVRPADGSLGEYALRGETAGSRYPIAKRTTTVDAEGNDFALHFEQFEDGPVCLETDAALIAAAKANAGGDVTGSPRDASALIVHDLSDAPGAPVTEHDDPAPAAEPEQPIHNGPITLTVDEHTQAKSLLSRIEAHIAYDGRWALDELKALLRHV